MPMIALIRAIHLCCAVVAVLVAGQVQALAHRPYFTQTETITLPDGSPGEMRLLHGDGIFFADPIRAIILDTSGRAIARTHQTNPMVIVCSEQRRCHAFDLARRLVLEPDAASFRVGPVVAEDTQRWSIETAEGTWGFSRRRATVMETVLANLAFARDHKFDLSVTALLAALGAAIVFKRLRMKMWPKNLRWLIWAAIGTSRGVAAVVLLLVSIYWAALTGLGDLQWFGASVAGGASMLALMLLMRRLGVRFSPA